MPEDTRRGYIPTDKKEFGPKQIEKLRRAQEDIVMLLDRGYGMEQATTFVGNHFLLSKRQRMALIRSSGSTEDINQRMAKERKADFFGQTLWIDGFNCIIPLEIALCQSTLVACMDGLIRDLAGLHGTYRVIVKTEEAIGLIRKKLEQMEVQKANIYLDAPISNAGRLKQCIAEGFSGSKVELDIMLVPNADKCLLEKEMVVSGDAIILNACKSYVNLVRMILEDAMPNYPYVDLSGNQNK